MPTESCGGRCWHALYNHFADPDRLDEQMRTDTERLFGRLLVADGFCGGTSIVVVECLGLAR